MSNLTLASKLFAGRKALSALAVVGVALSPAAASAKGWGHHHGGYGAAVAGGLILGAIVADAAYADSYDAPACWTEKRVRYGAYGERYVTRVRVCD
ncbi:hypothetical protein IHQ68_14895 [Chelatococcus sambhunathii]|uniref:Uncharacterized protein n=1 Tax=Chelatococcus sambhunathii TaxID=363953 RepID=A0ABU1DIG6_9HYPH|nr:hypothetical protein [Chelatococcus sambhunathii]MDR4307907.1 hypothetical protein [Chelatococcus sambhunathii]